MIRKNKLLLASLLISLAILFVAALCSSIITRNKLQLSVGTNVNYIPTYEVEDIQFTAKQNNTHIIIIPLKNTALWNTQNHQVQLLHSGTIIRKMEFNGSNIGDPADFRFQFEPIPDSKNNNYTVKIIPDPDPEQRPLKIGIDSSQRPTYKVYYHSTSLTQTFSTSFDSFTQFIVGDSIFFITWTMILGLGTALAIRK